MNPERPVVRLCVRGMQAEAAGGVGAVAALFQEG